MIPFHEQKGGHVVSFLCIDTNSVHSWCREQDRQDTESCEESEFIT